MDLQQEHVRQSVIPDAFATVNDTAGASGGGGMAGLYSEILLSNSMCRVSFHLPLRAYVAVPRFVYG